MPVLYAFLILIEILSASLLITVIFLQKSSGAGMGTAFGGAGESIFGSRMGNVLTKATVVLAAIFLANTTMLAWVGARRRPASVVDRVPLHQQGLPARGAELPLVPQAHQPDEMEFEGGVMEVELPGGEAGGLDFSAPGPAPVAEPPPLDADPEGDSAP